MPNKKIALCFVSIVLTACASTPEIAPFSKTKETNLSVSQVQSKIMAFVDEHDDVYLDSMSDSITVISSTNKDQFVSCRVGFGDTFRSANSKYFFRNNGNVWTVRSEHEGRAGIGSGNSDIAEFKGVDIPCVSTGVVEKAILNSL